MIQDIGFPHISQNAKIADGVKFTGSVYVKDGTDIGQSTAFIAQTGRITVEAAVIGKDVLVVNTNPDKLVIGKGVVIGDGAKIEASVGENTYIGVGSVVKAPVGTGCMIFDKEKVEEPILSNQMLKEGRISEVDQKELKRHLQA